MLESNASAPNMDGTATRVPYRSRWTEGGTTPISLFTGLNATSATDVSVWRAESVLVLAVSQCP